MGDGNKSKAFMVLMSAMMIFSSGCGQKDVGTIKIKQCVLENLQEFYGGAFEIQSIKKNSVGYTAGLTEQVYDLDVYSESLDVTFMVRITRDGSKMADDYEKYLYGKRVEEEIDSFAKEENGWKLEKLKIDHYGLSYKKRSRDFEDYKQSLDKLEISMEAKVTGSDKETIADSLFAYLKQFQDHDYNYIMDLNYNDELITLRSLYDEAPINRETIIEKINSTGEK